ncbi:MAG: flagellar motor protein MotA [bacterium]|nr:flagellar motor protein MotA [bacterium]
MRWSAPFLRIFLLLAFIAATTLFLAAPLKGIFSSNIPLNGLILVVFAAGILHTLYALLTLSKDGKWLEARLKGLNTSSLKAPKLLGSLARIEASKGNFSRPENASLCNQALDQLHTQLQERQQVGRYIVGSLVFLGLLGTFWGLTNTVQSISQLISNMPSGQSAGGFSWESLKNGLSAPLYGMGIAFSSSLFGLAASLALGFVELQASLAGRRFFAYVEGKLAISPHLAMTADKSLGDPQSVAKYIYPLLTQTAENLESLQRNVTQSEESRVTLNNNLTILSEKLSRLADQRHTEKNLLIKVAESLVDSQATVSQFSDRIREGDFGLDEGTRSHIRNVDTTLSRLGENLATANSSLSKELRDEMRLLRKTLASNSVLPSTRGNNTSPQQGIPPMSPIHTEEEDPSGGYNPFRASKGKKNSGPGL